MSVNEFPPVPPRLRIGLIGVGRTGSVVAAALRRVGHQVVAAHGRSDLSRVRAEALLPGVPLVGVRETVAAADLIIVAVSDDALVPVLDEIAPMVTADQTVVHLSGRYGADIINSRLSATGLAVHPVMTFTGTSLDLARMEGCPFGITAADDVLPVAASLVIEMGGEPLMIPESARPVYHAALAHGANHLATLVAQTLDILSSVGIDDPAELIGPLLRAALDNRLRHGDSALTGPVARGDAGTVAAHLDALRSQSPDVYTTYVTLARVTAERAHQSGMLGDTRFASVRDALDQAGGE